MVNWMYQNQVALSEFIVARFRVVWDLVEEKSGSSLLVKLFVLKLKHQMPTLRNGTLRCVVDVSNRDTIFPLKHHPTLGEI
jgi:hypothetical protein